MRLNRREFVRAGATVLPWFVTRRISAQPTRRIFLVAHGLSVIVVGRAAGQSGLPASSPRVDLLFVDNPAHQAPLFFVGNQSIGLSGCELRVGGKILSPPGVKLIQQPKVEACPKGAQWLSMTLIPDFEKILNLPGKIGVDPRCLDAKAPRLVRGRMSFRNGTLAGGTPNYKYLGERWQFPGNKTYISAFTDTLNWEVSADASTDLSFEAVEFATGNVKQTITIPAGPDDVVAGVFALPNTPQANTNSIPHFDHYYDLLTGVTARPIPQIGPKAACTTPIFTTEQFNFSRTVEALKGRFLKLSQQFDDFDQYHDGCAADGFAETVIRRRSDPGICISGIAYADIK
jgi:hypothetical protein